MPIDNVHHTYIVLNKTGGILHLHHFTITFLIDFNGKQTSKLRKGKRKNLDTFDTIF